MKEYLNTITYRTVRSPYIPERPDWIEVPEGAERYVKSKNMSGFVRHNQNGEPSIWLKDCGSWLLGKYEDGDEVLWQRPALPEALPFIDDEPIVEKVRFNSDVLSHKHSNAEPTYLSVGYYIRPKPRKRMYAVLGEWSPDWSQAPKWADAWRTTECGQSWWTSGGWAVRGSGWNGRGFAPQAEKAPSFGYVGDWKQSEHKRPVRMEVSFGFRTMTAEQERNAVAALKTF